MSEKPQDDCVGADDNKENDSSPEEDDDNRFTFARSIPNNAPVIKSGMSEA